MIKNIKKYIGEIMIIIGSGLFSYNVFNFSHTRGEYYLGLGAKGIVYYYSTNSLTLISLGVVLTVLGILIIKREND